MAVAGAKESFERAGEALEHVFEALGAATKDEALKADAKEAGRLLVEAVNATFTQASSELKDRINRH